jgi:DnaJ-class molecular chaperone
MKCPGCDGKGIKPTLTDNGLGYVDCSICSGNGRVGDWRALVKLPGEGYEGGNIVIKGWGDTEAEAVEDLWSRVEQHIGGMNSDLRKEFRSFLVIENHNRK